MFARRNVFFQVELRQTQGGAMNLARADLFQQVGKVAAKLPGNHGHDQGKNQFSGEEIGEKVLLPERDFRQEGSPAVR